MGERELGGRTDELVVASIERMHVPPPAKERGDRGAERDEQPEHAARPRVKEAARVRRHHEESERGGGELRRGERPAPDALVGVEDFDGERRAGRLKRGGVKNEPVRDGGTIARVRWGKRGGRCVREHASREE